MGVLDQTIPYDRCSMYVEMREIDRDTGRGGLRERQGHREGLRETHTHKYRERERERVCVCVCVCVEIGKGSRAIEGIRLLVTVSFLCFSSQSIHFPCTSCFSCFWPSPYAAGASEMLTTRAHHTCVLLSSWPNNVPCTFPFLSSSFFLLLLFCSFLTMMYVNKC